MFSWFVVFLSSYWLVDVSAQCTASQFKCTYLETCIPLTAQCDGVADCLLGEDETGCGLYTCAGSGQQIAWQYLCDGSVQDCPYGDDEYCPFCAGYQCDAQGTSLKTCIPPAWLCDGEADCLYGDDEENCPTATPTVSPTSYPSKTPSTSPTQAPSLPTTNPTLATSHPTNHPSTSPTAIPSTSPTKTPSQSPSVPTVNPTEIPTTSPTTKSPTRPFTLTPVSASIQCGDTITGSTSTLHPVHYFSFNLMLFQSSLVFHGCDTSFDSKLAVYSWNEELSVWSVLQECDDCGPCSGNQERLELYDVHAELYYLAVSGYTDGVYGAYEIQVICSNTMEPTTASPTAPTADPSAAPTRNETAAPTEIPTVRSTSNPTVFYSTSSTHTPTPSISEDTNDDQDTDEDQTGSGGEEAEQEIQVSIKQGGFVYFVIVIVAVIAVLVSILCVAYLAASKLCSRTQEIGTASLKQTFKELGSMERLSLLLEVFDMVTDYLFAADLITMSNESVQILGWISLLAAVIGMVFFYIKLLLTKKLIGFQIPALKQELNRRISTAQSPTEADDNEKGKNALIRKMRVRRMDIDVIALLIGCVEDVPQTLIVVVIVTSSIGWSYTSLMKISMSMAAFIVKCLQIIMAKYGCKDPDDITRENAEQAVQLGVGVRSESQIETE